MSGRTGEPITKLVDTLDALQPYSMSAGLCEFCGNVHVYAYDEHGKIILAAAMPLDIARYFQEQLDAAIDGLENRPKEKPA